MLRRGSRGQDVVALQQMLTAAGYHVPQTGFYGDITERAVRDYQLRTGLHSDGIAGPKTMSALAPPLPRPNPARQPADLAAAISGGGGQGATASLADLFAAPPSQAVGPIGGGIGSDPDRNLGTLGDPLFDRMTQAELDAGRVNTDYRFLRNGAAPPNNTGARLPPQAGSDRSTANSIFADPSVTSYAPPPSLDYAPVGAVQPPAYAPAPAPPVGLGDAVTNLMMPQAMRLIDLFQVRGGGGGR